MLKAAERAPSAGFSQGYSFLVLEGAEQCAPLWKILAGAVDAGGGTKDEDPAEVTALSTAQLVIVPLACHKLVRDQIPGIIAVNGGQPATRVLERALTYAGTTVRSENWT